MQGEGADDPRGPLHRDQGGRRQDGPRSPEAGRGGIPLIDSGHQFDRRREGRQGGARLYGRGLRELLPCRFQDQGGRSPRYTRGRDRASRRGDGGGIPGIHARTHRQRRHRRIPVGEESGARGPRQRHGREDPRHPCGLRARSVVGPWIQREGGHVHHERTSAARHRRSHTLHEDRAGRVQHTRASHDGPRRRIHDERGGGEAQARGDDNVRSRREPDRSHVPDRCQGRRRHGHGRDDHRYRDNQERQAEAGARGCDHRRDQDQGHGRGDLHLGDRRGQPHLCRQRRRGARSAQGGPDMLRGQEVAVAQGVDIEAGRRIPQDRHRPGRELGRPGVGVLQDPPHAARSEGLLPDGAGSAQDPGRRPDRSERGRPEDGRPSLHTQCPQARGAGIHPEGRFHSDRCPPRERGLPRIRLGGFGGCSIVSRQRHRHGCRCVHRQVQGAHQGQAVHRTDAGAPVRGVRLLQAGFRGSGPVVEGDIRRCRGVLMFDQGVEAHHRDRRSGELLHPMGGGDLRHAGVDKRGLGRRQRRRSDILVGLRDGGGDDPSFRHRGRQGIPGVLETGEIRVRDAGRGARSCGDDGQGRGLQGGSGGRSRGRHGHLRPQGPRVQIRRFRIELPDGGRAHGHRCGTSEALLIRASTAMAGRRSRTGLRRHRGRIP